MRAHLAAFFRVADWTYTPCPYRCYLLPKSMSRDSSCLDVISFGHSCPWVRVVIPRGVLIYYISYQSRRYNCRAAEFQ